MEAHFLKINEQKTLLTNCTDLYKTLTNHFTSLQNSIELKSQTLDSKFKTLDSKLSQTLDSLKTREDSIPELSISLSSDVETRKTAALSEVSILSLDEYAPLLETLKSVCRRMNPGLMTKLMVGKRRQSTTLRGMMSEALLECVDAPRFVVEVVREFVEMKREKKDGLSDKRLACTIVVGGMFPPDDLKDGVVKTGFLGRGFAKKAVERAEEVLREWKEVADEGSGMGPSESAMFIEMAVGFGLKEKFEDEFYRKLMVEFCERRDMAKLAISIFGDKVAEFIEEMVNTGKEVEAVYFAYESGLTKRFQPASLLKSASRKSKMYCTDILKKGNHSQAATDDANSTEMTSIKAIIKCVEDLKLEEQYPIENLKKRLEVLFQAKADRKKGITTSKSKRPGGARASGPPPSRHSKMQKLSNPSTTFTVNYHGVSPSKLSPVSRYADPYPYPSQAYGPSYGGSYIPATAPAAPAGVDQHYSQQQYGSQGGYASYDYGAATTTPAYPPPAYPQ